MRRGPRVNFCPYFLSLCILFVVYRSPPGPYVTHFIQSVGTNKLELEKIELKIKIIILSLDMMVSVTGRSLSCFSSCFSCPKETRDTIISTRYSFISPHSLVSRSVASSVAKRESEGEPTQRKNWKQESPWHSPINHSLCRFTPLRLRVPHAFGSLGVA